MNIQRFHGVDLHKRHATVSVRDRSGEEVGFHAKLYDFGAYACSLGPQDAVVLEASSGTFFWADAIRRQEASCMIIDPGHFRIIRDSWQKTDRRDAVNLSLTLWLSQISQQVRLPEVYQPRADGSGAAAAVCSVAGAEQTDPAVEEPGPRPADGQRHR